MCTTESFVKGVIPRGVFKEVNGRASSDAVGTRSEYFTGGEPLRDLSDGPPDYRGPTHEQIMVHSTLQQIFSTDPLRGSFWHLKSVLQNRKNMSGHSRLLRPDGPPGYRGPTGKQIMVHSTLKQMFSTDPLRGSFWHPKSVLLNRKNMSRHSMLLRPNGPPGYRDSTQDTNNGAINFAADLFDLTFNWYFAINILNDLTYTVTEAEDTFHVWDLFEFYV
ncbi:hypothetical protein K438DRAFT_1769021 [Mycena galopus ATCC 62051]|nr:hypothetical protein K438DRAFT_1769021 [Mycena galopus ATCC 62051]